MKNATNSTKTTKEDEKNTVSLYLRVPARIRQAVKEIAHEDGLTMNAVFINLMNEALRNRARKMGR